ncbi:MAG: DUF1853 family protein [Crocinitomicaceae bacterium]|nr:DUF1853 family protein [Crocinitomicaceae bacterium]
MMTERDAQYEGFINTPLLWHDDAIFGLQQFDIPNDARTWLEPESTTDLRLGILVERFVLDTFRQNKSISILAENVQIQQGKITVGELDCLLDYNGSQIHVEIVYKFYLYDESVGDTELEHWIGPNRNDSLVEKLTKLKEKQLPLLHHPSTKKTLQTLQLEVNHFQQQVYFKAQLFVPLSLNKSFEHVNNTCVIGIYIHLHELKGFSNYSFHMPTKMNWLSEVHNQVDWLSYDQFIERIKLLIKKRLSPMCWIKDPNGALKKCFIVWWDSD